MKKVIAIMLIGVMVLLAACGAGGGGNKTVNTKEEVGKMAEEFYASLRNADSYKLTSYYNDEPSSIVTKEQDKIHMELLDDEFGYEYFGFIQDGKKYIITDDGDLYEDEFTYDLAGDTVETLLAMTVFGYLDEGVDDEGVSYSATQKGDNELVTTVKGKSEDISYEITLTGKKEGGNITEIISEMKADEESAVTRYEISYDAHVELPEYHEAKTYDNMPHVDSPFKNYGEIIETFGEDDNLNYNIMDNELIVIAEKDGKHYQLSSIVDQETLDKYDALDFMSDDYDKKVYELLSPIEIEDCIDFTDELLSQAEIDGYVGNEISKMVDDGFEVMGYSFWEDNNFVFASRDYMVYIMEVELPDGFDPDGEFEYEDLSVCKVKGIKFDSVEPAALPMR